MGIWPACSREHGVFTPLMFSTTGGMGQEATAFYKRLADILAQKQQKPYSVVIRWLRCKLSFAAVRSSISCASVELGHLTTNPYVMLTLSSQHLRDASHINYICYALNFSLLTVRMTLHIVACIFLLGKKLLAWLRPR